MKTTNLKVKQLFKVKKFLNLGAALTIYKSCIAPIYLTKETTSMIVAKLQYSKQ